MRNRLSYGLLGVVALLGCNPTVVPPDMNIIVLETGMPDTNRPDTNVADTNTDTGGGSCSGTGRIGAHCRSGSSNRCVNGSTCLELTTPMTIQEIFGIPSGTLTDPAHMDYQLIDTSATAETAPFNGVAGGICAQQCDTSVADTCGACTTCNATLTQMPLLAAFGGIIQMFRAADRTYGTNTGICRLDCTYDQATRGAECPDSSFTCDRFSSVCVEACTTDNECNTAYGVTYEGELVTLVNHDHGDVCNTTTGRCEFPAAMGHAGAVVGATCTSNADCAPGTGICLNGGHCAEFGCANPNTATSTCGGGATPPGICLTTNASANPTALCLMGCTTANDCGPGNICNTLTDASGAVVMIGSYSGYCIGVCGSDDECIAAESCTDYNTVDATGMVTSNNGRCVPRCTDLNHVGTGAAGQCDTNHWCEPDASNTNGHACTTATDCNGMAPYSMCIFGVCRSSTPTFGQCSLLGGFCGAADTHSLPAAQRDCPSTQVCDETLATPHDPMTHAVSQEQFGDGHCVDACTDNAGCVADGFGATSQCVTTGPLTGLCRIPCVGTPDAGTGGDAGPSTECPADQTCDAALHFCVEVATM